MKSSPNISNWPVEGLGEESQEDGVRSRPAESATGPMKKIPHRGRVTVWPSSSVPCRLGFLISNFRVRPGQRREFSCTAHTGDAQLIRAGSSATNSAAGTRFTALQVVGKRLCALWLSKMCLNDVLLALRMLWHTISSML